MSTYEDDLRQALSGEFDANQLWEAGDATVIFQTLADAYPRKGSKIDWNSVVGAIECIEADESLQCARFAGFFDEMCSRFDLEGPVHYAGDSATDFALGGSLEAMRRVLPELIEIPQHHYFIGPDCTWCICLTMEGDMNFGMSSRRSRVEGSRTVEGV